MAIEKVKDYFEQFGMRGRVIEFAESSATVELAAHAAGVEPGRIAKSISFKVDDAPVLIIVAGDEKIDNAKYKQTFHTKARMLGFDEVEQLVGLAVGGVCPFAVNDGVRVYLDESLRRFPTVFPAAGSSNSAIELTPEEMEKYAQNFMGWVDVCK